MPSRKPTHDLMDLLLILCIVHMIPCGCRILRLQCKTIADFVVEKKGYRLHGPVLKKIQNVGLHQCYGLCLHEFYCKSFNIQSNGFGVCQLKSSSSDDAFDNAELVRDENWDYHSTNFSDRSVGHNCRNMNPCKDDEICLDTCTCPGYRCLKCVGNNQGIHCNRCASNPCKNGGTCNHFNDPICTCRSGYTGTFCQEELNECASNPCYRGTCTDHFNRYSCSCMAGWTGTKCYINVNECASSPCFNGNCVDLINSYSCNCFAGWTGTRCNKDIDECTSSPCYKGTCINHVNSYICSCSKGWTGTRCNVDINECASSPCKNGNCRNLEGRYYCDCWTLWSGTRCSKFLGKK